MSYPQLGLSTMPADAGGMKSFKVWTNDRKVKKGIVAHGFDDLKSKCQQSFNIPEDEIIYFTLESDGTEVGREYLDTLPANEVLLVLRHWETWQGQPLTVYPTVGQPTAWQPTAGQPTAIQPTAGQPTAVQPTAGQNTAGQTNWAVPTMQSGTCASCGVSQTGHRRLGFQKTNDLPIATVPTYSNSLDPDQTPSNSASDPEPCCLTLGP